VIRQWFFAFSAKYSIGAAIDVVGYFAFWAANRQCFIYRHLITNLKLIMKYSANKDLNTFVVNLIKKGWTFSRQGSHGKIRTPNGAFFVVVPSTPSDRRAFLNFRSDIKRLRQF